MTAGAGRGLVLGCLGGVGSAVLALLDHTDAGRAQRARLDALVLADRQIPPGPIPLSDALLLPPTRVTSADDLG